MDKTNIKFDDTEIEKYEFHQYKSPISINDIDLNKIIVSIITFLLGNRILNISLVRNIIKKL